MEDIEDVVGSEPISRVQQSQVLPKRNRRRLQEENPHGHNIPGTERIYVRTWGCSHNNSDSEYMAGLLAAYGYEIVDDPDTAALWLLNSCAVKTPAEESFNGMIRSAQAAGKPVVLAGCVPQAQPRGKMTSGLSIVGVQQIDRVVEVVEETLKGNVVRLVGQKKADGRRTGGAGLNLPKIRRNPWVEIIPINSGCLNQCTYCKTKHARGDLASYTVEELLARVKAVLEEGVVEIWLTSEDTGTYGRDLGTDLPTLLWGIVGLLPPGVMLRLGMTNPPYILEHLEEMAKLLNHPRVYAFLHIPIQSASDQVLYDMKREYTQADFRRIVDFLREQVPGITIATDLICGFPGETTEQFEETLKLVDEYRFPVLFTNQFFPRPGTPAAKMEKVPTQEVKRRTREVSALFRSYFPYTHKVGQVQDVLITETSADGHLVGHNKYYEQVLIEQQDEIMGRMVTVKITRTGKYFLYGEVIPGSVPLARPLGVTPSLVSLSSGSAPIRHRKKAVDGTFAITPMSTEAPLVTQPRSRLWSVLTAVLIVLLLDLLRVLCRHFS